MAYADIQKRREWQRRWRLAHPEAVKLDQDKQLKRKLLNGSRIPRMSTVHRLGLTKDEVTQIVSNVLKHIE